MNQKNIAEYHLWANEHIRKVIRNTSLDDFEREVAGRKASDITEHIVAALITCFNILKPSTDGSVYEWLESAKRDELLTKWSELDQQLSDLLLENPRGKVKIPHVSDRPFEIDTMDFALQYLFHTHHHRGQLGLVLRGLGYDIPGTDYLHFFAERA